MVEPESHTLVLLREIRADIAELKSELREEIAAVEGRLSKRLDAMHLNGVKALRGLIGHRSMTERAMAGVDDQFARLEDRGAAPEALA